MSTAIGGSHERSGMPGVSIVDRQAQIEQRHFRTIEEAFPRSLVITRPVIRMVNTLIETKINGRQKKLGELTYEERAQLTRNAHIVWLEGLYERSNASRQETIRRRGDFRGVFPDATDDQIEGFLDGSAFAPLSYDPDPRFVAGNNPQERWANLGKFADQMRGEFGVGVYGDWIFNHVAKDSPLVRQHPDWFVHVRSKPDTYDQAAFDKDFFPITTDRGETYYIAYARWTKRGGTYIPEGDDKDVEPWTDLAQLNLANEEMVRKLLIPAALKHGAVFDGARIDAAALLTKQVFWDNWEHLIPWEYKKDYWQREPILPRLLKAAQSEARKHGRTFNTVGETFGSFGQSDYLKQTIGQINASEWYFGLYDVLWGNRSVSQFAYDLHENLTWDGTLDHTSHGMVYFEDHDQPPAAQKVGTDRAIVGHELLELMAQGSYLIHYAQQDGYKGDKIDVQVGTRPNFSPDPRVQKAFDTAFVIKSSTLFQEAPPQNYTVLQVPQDGYAWHPRIVPLQVTSADGREGAVACFNLSRENAYAEIPIPKGATKLEVFDMVTGEPIRNRGEVENGKLKIFLDSLDSRAPSRQHAQIIRYDLPKSA